MSDHDETLHTDALEDDLLDNKPGWPKLVGILSIVFGAISVTCSGANFVLLPMQKGMIEPLLEGAPPPPNMDLSPMMIASMGVGILWNVLLLVGGIALVLRKPVARAMHLVYAVLSVPIIALSLWIFVTMNAEMSQWVKDYPDNQFAQQQAQAGPIGLIIGLVLITLSLAWPVFCAVWFGAVKRTNESMGAVIGDDVA